MLESPDAVLLYVPLMKNLGMSWRDIKDTPRWELQGLLSAHYEHEQLHSMDGYSDKQVNDMAKHDSSIRSQWSEYQKTKAKFEELTGQKRKPVSFSDMM